MFGRLLVFNRMRSMFAHWRASTVEESTATGLETLVVPSWVAEAGHLTVLHGESSCYKPDRVKEFISRASLRTSHGYGMRDELRRGHRLLGVVVSQR